jgi:hypothetical protein
MEPGNIAQTSINLRTASVPRKYPPKQVKIIPLYYYPKAPLPQIRSLVALPLTPWTNGFHPKQSTPPTDPTPWNALTNLTFPATPTHNFPCPLLAWTPFPVPPR